MTTEAPPEWFRKIIGDFYREQAVERHAADVASFHPLGRWIHKWFTAWRCPACKAGSAPTATGDK